MLVHDRRPVTFDQSFSVSDFVETLRRPEWHARAACRDVDVNFFPVVGEPASEAKALCATCPVRTQCLRTAIDGHEIGVWGGRSTRERNKTLIISRRNAA